MTNRRDYHKRTGKDAPRPDGRYVRLTEYMLASPAWQSLDGNCRALYVELARRYRGPNSNNGRIPFSVREAAAALHIGRSTAQRCFEQLQERGFVKIGKRSGFSMKGRVSTEWALTEFPDDTTTTTGIASKDFMKWKPQNSFHSPTSDTHSPTTEPGVDLTWDRVAQEQRLWPCSGTVSPEFVGPQSHHKDTTHLPGGSGSAVPEQPARQASSPGNRRGAA
jgi:DNA-binding transcriptional MocR family regulator